MSLDTLLIVALLLGAFAGALLLFRSKDVYFGFAALAWQKLHPILFAYISKRMTAEQEKALHQTVRRGQEWDHFRKRPKDK